MTLAARMLCAALLLTAATAKAAPMSPVLAGLAARVMPAVVSIASTDPVDNKDSDATAAADHPGTDASGTVLPPPKAIEALGSGFVFDPSGYILTNNHVIAGASSVTVTFQDGTILPATVAGRDTAADLAVLKVDAGHRLAAVHFGDSGKLRVGDWVMAIGNPFGLPGSTSAGIVSALNRDIHSGAYDDFIQTDAAINRGNSGGPLFNMQGEVIGVDSAIYSPSGGSDGIGFAIPSAMAAPVAQALKSSGVMTRGWLGASTEEVTPAIQKLLGLPDTFGALVGAVAGQGPAAGKLAPGDVLVELGGVPAANPRALLIRTAEIPAGQKLTAEFWRNGKRKRATLVLAVPPAAASDTITPIAPPPPENMAIADLGLTVSEKPAEDGISVIAASGPAEKAGIVAGDVIDQVAGQDIANATAFQAELRNLAQSGMAAAVLLVRGDTASGTNPGPRWITVAFEMSRKN